MKSTIRGKNARINNGPLTADESRELRVKLKILRARTPHGLLRPIARVLMGSRSRNTNGQLLSLIRSQRELYRATATRIERILVRTGSDPIEIARFDAVARRRCPDLFLLHSEMRIMPKM